MGYQLKKEKRVINTKSCVKKIRKLLEDDEDPLFTMHPRELFRKESEEYKEYKLLSQYKYTFTNKDKFDRYSILRDINPTFCECMEKGTTINDIVNSIADENIIECYSIIMITIYATIRKSFDCEFNTQEESIDVLFKQAIKLYKEL